MEPYYDHAGITIYHADCRDVIDQLEADVVVTDPPYGIDGGRGGGNRARGKGRYVCDGWEDTQAYVESVCIPALAGALEICGRGAMTFGASALPAMLATLPPADIGCFWHPAGVGFGSWGTKSYSPILFYGRDPRAGVAQVPSGYTLTEAAGSIDHPCPKPYRAWKWLVAKASLEGETVIDPFMGSGTTLVVAKHLGRKAIGIEIEERYCEVAATRLQQEVLSL